jgi:hypothetical protein
MREEEEDLADMPKRPLLYMFQHVALREAAFENHPELIRELAGSPSRLPLLHFQSKARLLCRQFELNDSLLEDDDAAMTLFSAVKIHPHTQDGYTAYIVSMPEPESSLEAYFVAILHKDDEPHEYMARSLSTRYFTLEKADPPSDRPLFCEWFENDSRNNYGDGPVPTLAAFTTAVFERVYC